MTHILELVLVLIVVKGILSSWISSEDMPCQARTLPSGTVCVCDSGYCDTVASPPTLSKGQFHHYYTAQSSPGFSSTHGSFSKDACTSCGNGIIIEIHNDVQYQEIHGFGGCFTDSAGIVFNSLSEDVKDYFIRSYFGVDGIEYTTCRVPIGGTDFSTHLYTLDDVCGDEDLQYFGLTFEDYCYKIPMIQKAQKVSSRGVSVCAAAWHTPNWMKTQAISGYLKSEYYRIWALYHVKFLEAYRDNGIDIWAISGGNEVAFFDVYGIPTNFTVWKPENQACWFKHHLLPEMRIADLSHVKLMALDDQRPFALDWMSYLCEDEELSEAVCGVALHWYFDYVTAADILDDFHSKYPDKSIMYTEASINTVFLNQGESAVELGSWRRAEIYTYDIIENMNHWATCFIDWNLALDESGGPTIEIPIDAAIIVNSTCNEFYKQPIFYALGHFSKFIPPGSKRVRVKTPYEDRDDFEKKNVEATDDTSALHEVGSSCQEEDGRTQLLPTGNITIPLRIHCLATANSDCSHTILLFNPLEEAADVTLFIPELGCAYLQLLPHSINSFIYWM